MTRHTFTLRQAFVLTAFATALLAGSLGFRAQTPSASRYNPLRAEYMRAHFNQAMALHDAVARGDLERARTEARILAERSPSVPMPAGSEAFHGLLTSTAREGATARTLPEAAQATASVLGICGQCHQAMHVRATVPGDGEIKVGGLVGHMLLHQHGSDAMIEGLVAPSDSQWGEGVRTFASPKLEAEHAPGKLRHKMEDAESAIAGLAGRAAQAHRTRDRAEIYGEILATCGDCHKASGRTAGPVHE